MGKRKGRGFVINASVARAAGQTTHPVSSACRAFLQEILDQCHQVVVADAILDEWRQHASRYFWRWLAIMKGKKKYVRLKATADPDLHDRIEQINELTDNERNAVLKDKYLLEAAVKADAAVASCDERVRHLLVHKVASQVKAIQPIMWVNPTRPEENCLEWLKEGAPSDRQRTLG